MPRTFFLPSSSLLALSVSFSPLSACFLVLLFLGLGRFFVAFIRAMRGPFRPANSRVHMPLNMPCDSRSSGRLFVSMVAIYRLQTRTPGEETTARSGNRGPALENNEI